MAKKFLAAIEIDGGGVLSGLKFTRLTSASASGTGKTIGVDSSGNVITVDASGSGATINRGETVVDFGAFSARKSDTSISVTGQTGITGTSIVNAWISAKATGDHSIDEHCLEPIQVFAGNIQAGVGFTIYAISRNLFNARPHGLFTVQWQWV